MQNTSILTKLTRIQKFKKYMSDTITYEIVLWTIQFKDSQIQYSRQPKYLMTITNLHSNGNLVNSNKNKKIYYNLN